MRAHPASARIELRLRELAQLFNSMDPSPFIDRDLDTEAEGFIASWARESHGTTEFELVVHLTTPPSPEAAAGAQSAVQHYFASRVELKQREFRQLLRRGRTSLIVGVLFLTACLILGEVIGHGRGSVASIIKESLTIGGWVAMWRPLEIYLYDWWPLREEIRLLERLSRLRVSLQLPQP